MPIGDSEVMVAHGGDNCPQCDGITDVLCIAMNGCWEYIIGAVLGLTVIFFIIYCCLCKCVPCRLLNCCIKKATTTKP